jgi:NAD(P)-dependent dehydrogenase (short-subunit alcohol dehydrogenase family)
MSKLRFDDRVVIVTGAGRGLGRAYAGFLAEHGARVVVNDLGSSMTGDGADRSTAEEVVAEIAQSGGVAVANTDSVATAEGAQGIVDTALESFGRVDALINNAGIVVYKQFDEVDAADLQRQLDVHLIGSFNTSRAVWPVMVEQRYGRIVMTSSSAIFGRADVVTYSSAKAGVIGLGRSLAVAGGAHGIKVNVVVPRAHSRMWGQGDAPKKQDATDWPSPDQAAPIVGYLAHEACRVSGEIYRTGGGRHSRVFIAETPGAFAETLEEVRDSLDAINDEASYYVPPDSDSLNAHGMEIEIARKISAGAAQ